MPEHYTKNTEWVTRWCNKCSRHTRHGVSGGRIGRCMEHETPIKEKERKRDEQEKKQPKLF